MRLAGKVALVTGGGQGIGKAIALALAEEGTAVVVNDLELSRAEAVAKEIRDRFRQQSFPILANVADNAEVKKMVEGAVEKLGRIDILVNNAGTRSYGPSLELTEEDWHRVLGVNLDGVLFCSQAVAKRMVQQGSGSVINIASIAGRVPFPRRASYCVSKAGVIALTELLAVEWAEHNIRVNAVAPGFVDTELVRQAIAQGQIKESEIKEKIPLRRIAKPEEVARVVVFLASEEAGYITGETVIVDGGFLKQT